MTQGQQQIKFKTKSYNRFGATDGRQITDAHATK